MEIQTYSPGQVPEDMLSPAPPAAPPPPPAPSPAPRPPRRVGTVTLGLTLILLGILVPLALFLGGDMWRLLQLAPVVLLCLGVEILVYAVRYKHDRFKYDGLSILLVVLITFSALLGALLAPPLLGASAYAEKLDTAYMEVQQTAEDALAAADCTGDVQPYEGSRSWAAAFQDPEKVDYPPIYLQVELYTVNGSETPTREEVTAAFAAVAAACGRNEYLEHLQLYMEVEESQRRITYSAELTGSSIKSTSVSDMSARLRAEESQRATTPYQTSPERGFEGV